MRGGARRARRMRMRTHTAARCSVLECVASCAAALYGGWEVDWGGNLPVWTVSGLQRTRTESTVQPGECYGRDVAANFE